MSSVSILRLMRRGQNSTVQVRLCSALKCSCNMLEFSNCFHLIKKSHCFSGLGEFPQIQWLWSAGKKLKVLKSYQADLLFPLRPQELRIPQFMNKSMDFTTLRSSPQPKHIKNTHLSAIHFRPYH